MPWSCNVKYYKQTYKAFRESCCVTLNFLRNLRVKRDHSNGYLLLTFDDILFFFFSIKPQKDWPYVKYVTVNYFS